MLQKGSVNSWPFLRMLPCSSISPGLHGILNFPREVLYPALRIRMNSPTPNSLQIGQVFPRDLHNSTGELVLIAGQPVTESLLENLSRRGYKELFFRRAKTNRDSAATNKALLKPYAERDLTILRHAFKLAPELVDGVARALQEGQVVEMGEIEESINSCRAAVDSDAAAVLATVHGLLARTGDSAALHNVRMMALVMVASQLMDFEAEEVQAAGRAGLLHDVSLLQDRRELANSLQGVKEGAPLLNVYHQHPLRSADMLRQRMKGITELELVLVAQVHEQCDGSGFPRGLKRHHLHPLSRLLNVVDAFLTLIDEQNPHGGFEPADALAYMVMHSLQGSFDRECIQALIEASAAYPVGTKVVLEDDTVATVMRSTGEDLMPIIELENKPGQLIDLRNYAKQIVGPTMSTQLRRLPKALLHKRLWQLAV